MSALPAEPRTIRERHVLSNAVANEEDRSLLIDRVGHSAIVTVAIASIRDHHAELIAQRLASIATDRGGHLAINLSHVAEFSCAWINALVRLAASCEASGGRLVVFDLAEPAAKVLRRTGLDKQLHLCRGRNAALRALGEPAPSAFAEALSRFFGGGDAPMPTPVAGSQRDAA
jgi:anti-anti-sigma factor